jgi:hypothetical protein
MIPQIRVIPLVQMVSGVMVQILATPPVSHVLLAARPVLDFFPLSVLAATMATTSTSTSAQDVTNLPKHVPDLLRLRLHPVIQVGSLKATPVRQLAQLVNSPISLIESVPVVSLNVPNVPLIILTPAPRVQKDTTTMDKRPASSVTLNAQPVLELVQIVVPNVPKDISSLEQSVSKRVLIMVLSGMMPQSEVTHCVLLVTYAAQPVRHPL